MWYGMDARMLQGTSSHLYQDERKPPQDARICQQHARAQVLEPSNPRQGHLYTHLSEKGQAKKERRGHPGG